MNYFYKNLAINFILGMNWEEQRVTSWAEWRYCDNPEFAEMLLMGGEL
jgi:hypothetical protein